MLNYINLLHEQNSQYILFFMGKNEKSSQKYSLYLTKFVFFLMCMCILVGLLFFFFSLYM